jgi:hypothetical protein
MTLPIKPEDVVPLRSKNIPDWVIEAVNRLIVAKWKGDQAIVYQEEIVKQYLGDGDFDYHWLNFEDIFREAGWKVVYDKPHYSESYKAHFTFMRK